MKTSLVSAETQNSLGIRLAQQGKLGEAIEAFRQAISIQSDYVDAHYNLGTALAEQQDIDRAISCFFSVIQLNPIHTDALFNLAVLLSQQERLEESIACYQDLLLIEPENIDALLGLGSLFHKLDLLDQSIECYEYILKLQMDSVEVYTKLGDLLCGQNNFDRAVENYKSALNLSPDLEAEKNRLRSSLRHAKWCQEIQQKFDRSQPHLVLHVGCGSYYPEGLHEAFRHDRWMEVRFDIDPAVEPDIIGSLTDMSAVDSGSVDAIWSSHNVEHLYHHQVPIALAEFFRVLSPGGVALITLPDIQKVAEQVATGNLEDPLYFTGGGAPIAAIDILYGWGTSIRDGNHYMAHLTAFTAESLQQKLIAAGFQDVVVSREDLNLWAKAYKRA